MEETILSWSGDLRIPVGTGLKVDMDYFSVYEEDGDYLHIDTKDLVIDASILDVEEELGALQSMGVRGHIVLMCVEYHAIYRYDLTDDEVVETILGLAHPLKDQSAVLDGRTIVYSSTGEVGHTTGSEHKCRARECTGIRLAVRWDDGAMSYPCTKGMEYDESNSTWRIT